MRVLLSGAFLVLSACGRVPIAAPAKNNEIVFDDNGPFTRAGNEKRIDYVYAAEQPETLLLISWTTVSDFLDETHTSTQPDRFELGFGAKGDIWLSRRTVIRDVVEWSRYYPPAEAEHLFDSIIPAIEQFSLRDLRARPENYVVCFRYLTREGPRAHDCLLADLTPITSLLVSLRLGGGSLHPVGHSGVQSWVCDRFNIFPPER